jgi:hypothetical protein
LNEYNREDTATQSAAHEYVAKLENEIATLNTKLKKLSTEAPQTWSNSVLFYKPQHDRGTKKLKEPKPSTVDHVSSGNSIERVKTRRKPRKKRRVPSPPSVRSCHQLCSTATQSDSDRQEEEHQAAEAPKLSHASSSPATGEEIIQADAISCVPCTESLPKTELLHPQQEGPKAENVRKNFFDENHQTNTQDSAPFPSRRSSPYSTPSYGQAAVVSKSMPEQPTLKYLSEPNSVEKLRLKYFRVQMRKDWKKLEKIRRRKVTRKPLQPTATDEPPSTITRTLNNCSPLVEILSGKKHVLDCLTKNPECSTTEKQFDDPLDEESTYSHQYGASEENLTGRDTNFTCEVKNTSKQIIHSISTSSSHPQADSIIDNMNISSPSAFASSSGQPSPSEDLVLSIQPVEHIVAPAYLDLPPGPLKKTEESIRAIIRHAQDQNNSIGDQRIYQYTAESGFSPIDTTRPREDITPKREKPEHGSHETSEATSQNLPVAPSGTPTEQPQWIHFHRYKLATTPIDLSKKEAKDKAEQHESTVAPKKESIDQSPYNLPEEDVEPEPPEPPEPHMEIETIKSTLRTYRRPHGQNESQAVQREDSALDNHIPRPRRMPERFEPKLKCDSDVIQQKKTHGEIVFRKLHAFDHPRDIGDLPKTYTSRYLSGYEVYPSKLPTYSDIQSYTTVAASTPLTSLSGSPCDNDATKILKLTQEEFCGKINTTHWEELSDTKDNPNMASHAGLSLLGSSVALLALLILQ